MGLILFVLLVALLFFGLGFAAGAEVGQEERLVDGRGGNEDVLVNAGGVKVLNFDKNQS